MIRVHGTFVAALALAAAAVAQGQGPSRSDAAEMQRVERMLQQSKAEAERLLEQRLRHDLGLIPSAGDAAAEKIFKLTTPATSEAVDRLQLELREEESATALMRESYAKLRATVEQAQADAAAKAADNTPLHPLLAVPSAGRPVPTRASQARRETEAALAGAHASTTPHPAEAPLVGAAPNASNTSLTPAAPSKLPTPSVTDGAPLLEPPQAQIHASNDPRRIAQALFKAGQQLADEAQATAAAGDETRAGALAARSTERLRRALDALAPLLRAQEPAFDALFCQGRTLELLFRHSERFEGLNFASSRSEWQKREQEVRKPWLQIAARDKQAVGASSKDEEAGPWGRAAQAAVAHFDWTNLYGAYDARKAIEAITWPGAPAK
ncbi:MAG: hypothetical protein FJ301_09215 [Planctomycetes bacterium]|nr:hypothetical protein [Planctomycetota bacterium]